MPKQRWQQGDVFTVPLLDGTFGVGQVLGMMMENILLVALAARREPAGSPTLPLGRADVMSTLATWRDPLDTGRWKVVGSQGILFPQKEWPNEQFRERNWVGAKHYNTALVEGFLNAFHALAPWDAWHDPQYLDKLLLAPELKPSHLFLTVAWRRARVDGG